LLKTVTRLGDIVMTEIKTETSERAIQKSAGAETTYNIEKNGPEYRDAKFPTSPSEIQGLIASGALTLASIQSLKSQTLTSDVRAALEAAEKNLKEEAAKTA
jgi:hypothetical protein